MAVPGDVVTLLFTDIEGSTRAWQSSPGEMEVALARHDELLRGIIGSSNGDVFATAGDSFCVAFSDPADALRTALAVHRALVSEQRQLHEMLGDEDFQAAYEEGRTLSPAESVDLALSSAKRSG